MGFEELESLNIFTKEEFETRLDHASTRSLSQKANGKEMDYRDFIKGKDLRGDGGPGLPRRLRRDGGKGEHKDRPAHREDIHLGDPGQARRRDQIGGDSSKMSESATLQQHATANRRRPLRGPLLDRKTRKAFQVLILAAREKPRCQGLGDERDTSARTTRRSSRSSRPT